MQQRTKQGGLYILNKIDERYLEALQELYNIRQTLKNKYVNIETYITKKHLEINEIKPELNKTAKQIKEITLKIDNMVYKAGKGVPIK